MASGPDRLEHTPWALRDRDTCFRALDVRKGGASAGLMASTSPPAPHGATEAPRPVDSSERLILLDVLRGFALCGVFVSNAYTHLSGWGLVPKATRDALRVSRVDVVAEFLYERLLSGKAMAIFSFLFGLGFAIQLGRAEERGASIVSVYARRLGVLLLIGLTHLFAIWYGDVLHMYAVVGFVLLLFRQVPDRRLLVWSLVLMIGAPLVVVAALRLVPVLASSPDVVQDASRETFARIADIRARTLEAFQSGSYLTTARANIEFHLRVFFSPMMVSYALVTLGRFLLGLVAGRRRLFHDVEGNRPLFRRLLGWGLVVGLVGNGVGWLIRHLSSTGVIPKGALWMTFVPPAIWEVGVLGLAAFYVAAFALLFPRPRARRFLSVLAPGGTDGADELPEPVRHRAARLLRLRAEPHREAPPLGVPLARVRALLGAGAGEPSLAGALPLRPG